MTDADVLGTRQIDPRPQVNVANYCCYRCSVVMCWAFRQDTVGISTCLSLPDNIKHRLTTSHWKTGIANTPGYGSKANKTRTPRKYVDQNKGKIVNKKQQKGN